MIERGSIIQTGLISLLVVKSSNGLVWVVQPEGRQVIRKIRLFYSDVVLNSCGV